MMKSVPRWPVVAVALLALYLSMWPSKDEPQFPLDHTANMTTEENIRFYGYPYEKHLVQTEDGYILNLIRFPRRTSEKLPVLIVHGFMACSTSWVAMGPEGSLGYQLYDAGYDVWLADLRGNQYSVHHAYLEKNDTKFWDFTFDEMGRFDQPAFIDYILAATGHQTLVHLGYSMGSASFFIMTSMRSEYNAKVEAHIALAPAVFMKHSETAYWKLHDSFVFLNEYLNDMQGSFVHGMMPHFFFSFCNFNFLTRRCCKHITNNILGHSYSNKNESVYEVILHNGLTGSSLKTARHYIQLHESGGQFQRFDYGDEQLNLQHYGQPRPPHYDVSKTSIPVHIFYGATDIVCPEQDIMLLKKAITGPTDLTLVEEPHFNHGDFFMSNEAKTALNPKVLEKVRLINELHSKSKASVPPVETNDADSQLLDQKEKV